MIIVSVLSMRKLSIIGLMSANELQWVVDISWPLIKNIVLQYFCDLCDCAVAETAAVYCQN